MRKSYAGLACNDTYFLEAELQFESLIDQVSSVDALEQEFGTIENLVQSEGLELLRRLLQGHSDLRAAQEIVFDAIDGQDGERRTHKRYGVKRNVETLFGEVEQRRIGYSSVNADVLYPMDMSLNLGPSKYSDGLCRRVAEEASKNSFDECVNSVSTTTGGSVPKRQCEAIVAQVAQDFDDYYDSTAIDESDYENLLVITSDSKGIVMRTEDLREATKKAAEAAPKKRARLGPGEKRNRKRMATTAAVYSVDPNIKTPEQVLNRSSEQPKRPKIENKRVWASVERGQKSVISEAIAEAISRDEEDKREWVYVVDGEISQLDNIHQLLEQAEREATIVVDFIHVLEYVWKAAYCFHSVGSDEAEAWVLTKALELLKGKASTVAAAIRRSATNQKLSKKKRVAVDKCANYLLSNKAYLKYDEYLRLGYPIASGVIEGACRHLINDRLGITGARWGLKTAEAVLKIRSIRSSGDFDDYWDFHKNQEKQRNHSSKYLHPEDILVA